MGNPKVEINIDSFEKSDSGLVEGIIFVVAANRCFPDGGWFDFPVRLLGWWLDELISALSEGRTNVRLMFMDGPFLMQLKSLDGLSWNLTMLERSEREKIIGECDLDLDSFLQSLLDNSELFLQRNKVLGWRHDDIEFLDAALARAKLFKSH